MEIRSVVFAQQFRMKEYHKHSTILEKIEKFIKYVLKFEL